MYNTMIFIISDEDEILAIINADNPEACILTILKFFDYFDRIMSILFAKKMPIKAHQKHLCTMKKRKKFITKLCNPCRIFEWFNISIYNIEWNRPRNWLIFFSWKSFSWFAPLFSWNSILRFYHLFYENHFFSTGWGAWKSEKILLRTYK